MHFDSSHCGGHFHKHALSLGFTLFFVFKLELPFDVLFLFVVDGYTIVKIKAILAKSNYFHFKTI